MTNRGVQLLKVIGLQANQRCGVWYCDPEVSGIFMFVAWTNAASSIDIFLGVRILQVDGWAYGSAFLALSHHQDL